MALSLTDSIEKDQTADISFLWSQDVKNSEIYNMNFMLYDTILHAILLTEANKIQIMNKQNMLFN
jgi:hypothetical protein